MYFPFLLTTFLEVIRLSRRKQIFSYLVHATLLRFSLFTYYFFEGYQAELAQKFFRFSLIYHFTGFPYLLTTFFEGCQAELTSNFFISRLFTTLPDVLILTYYFFEGCSNELILWKKNLLSSSADYRLGFWHWKWHPKRVTPSSTSRNNFVSYLGELASDSGFDPGNDFR